MDNFDFKKYLAEGRIHESEDTVSEKKQGYNDKLDDSEGAKHGKKKQDMKQRRADAENMEKAKGKRKFSGDKSMDEVEEGYGKKYEEDDIKKEEMSKKYEEDDIKKEEMSSKMKKSDLKAKIKETILAELSLQEAGFEADDAGSQFHDSLYTEADEDVDVDVDFEDEVNVDAEGDDIEIERPAVKAKVQVGLSPEEEIVQDSLKAAMDAADALGNDKLADQIGNTITFFTREYVVGRNSD
jgi:urease accessory protein UreE